MSRGDAMAFMFILLTASLLIGYLAFKDGEIVSAPPVKSDREMCEVRGGVWIVLRSSPNRCFSKEAFK